MKRTILGLAVALFAAPAVYAAEADPVAGQQIHQQACFACHGTGVAGAPKTGDKGAWAPRVETGMDTLVKHAIEGFKGEKGFMPPKGGRTDLSDEQVADAVAYMVEQAK